MSTAQENFVSSDGARLWTAQTGHGVPVILCNGGPGCCDYLAPVAAMLDDVARVIRFEQRGCGRSDPAPVYTIEQCLSDLENIRRHYNVEQWIVGGHSWGADLALMYALAHTARVAGLICIAGGRMHNDREWHKEYTRRKDAEGEETPDFQFPVNREVNEQLNRASKNYIQNPNLFLAISRLSVPALFVYGERDIRPSWPSEQVANLMRNARFVRVEGAAHLVWSSHSAELRTLLRNFVQSDVDFDSRRSTYR